MRSKKKGDNQTHIKKYTKIRQDVYAPSNSDDDVLLPSFDKQDEEEEEEEEEILCLYCVQHCELMNCMHELLSSVDNAVVPMNEEETVAFLKLASNKDGLVSKSQWISAVIETPTLKTLLDRE